MVAIIINLAKIIFYSHLFDEIMIVMLNLDELKYLFEIWIYLSKIKNFRKNPRWPPVGRCTRLQ